MKKRTKKALQSFASEVEKSIDRIESDVRLDLENWRSLSDALVELNLSLEQEKIED